MNLGKLTKRLRKELVANPKQAAVLAVVCVVALWFWGPLLLKWFRPKGTEETATPDVAATNPEVAVSAPQERPVSWLEVQARRDADPLARSASRNQAARDPFATLQTAAVASDEGEGSEEETESTPAAVIEQLAEPAKVGLVLQSIAYSRSRRFAQISGKTVKEKDELTLGSQVEGVSATGPKLVAKVVSIGRSEVTLEIRGQEVQLKLQPKLLSENEIVERSR